MEYVNIAGLKVAKIGNGGVHNQAALVLGLPGRDEKIEEFKRNLRALAGAGIQTQLYAHMANGVWRTAPETNRGGAISTAFEEGKPATAGGSSHNAAFERAYTEDELWKSWEYFVKQIVPVAEETGVKIGVHTDDPPGLTMGNIPRPIFSSFEGYKRALRKVNFDGVLIGDHFPRMVTGETTARAYTLGYIQALMERANEEFLAAK